MSKGRLAHLGLGSVVGFLVGWALMLSHQQTLEYYEKNSQAYFSRTFTNLDGDAIREFTSRIPAGGKVLDAGCGSGRDLTAIHQLGFEVEGVDGSETLLSLARKELENTGIRLWKADFLFLSLEKDRYEGVWANQILIHLPPEGCQRMMATFFLALKKGGVLFVSFEEGTGMVEDRTDDAEGPARAIYRYSVDDVSSLVRQSGFQILMVGRRIDPQARAPKVGLLAKRI